MSDPMTPAVPDPTVEARCRHVFPDGTQCRLTDHSAPGLATTHAARAAVPDALRVAVGALREASEAASPGKWIAVTGKGPKRRLQQVALLGREDGRGLGAEGCLAVFSGIPATHRADDAEFAAACVNLVRDLLEDPALAGRATGGEG